MPEVWGKDAAVFNPYRWLKEDGQNISYSPFSRSFLPLHTIGVCILRNTNIQTLEYHSWNAGPRSCLGRALATYEGIVISAAILQQFDVILSDDSKDYEPLAAMNMVRRSSRFSKYL